uniref:beta-galactosidase n=1 Tax=Tessaracoccus timonensis TaxID=2161816 RepID=UPI000D55DEA2|nr:beta-galactosidase [Tessaracoccus timonensis]
MSLLRSKSLAKGVVSTLGAAALLATSGLLPAVAPPAGAALGPAASSQSEPATLIGDGKPHKVTFDKYSFKIDGQRLNVYSGEFHYWRLPSPDAWRDVLQKIKASGFNAVSLYFFWGLHQSEEGGQFDFSGIKDIDKLLTMAEEEGLFVIARPGPYVNAEISMGGLPAWLANKGHASLRSVENLQASKAWLNAFNKIAKKHLVTDGGGSVFLYQVENEIIAQQPRYEEFLKALVDVVKADGIDVPLFHNDWNTAGRFKDVDKYGTDFYASDVYPLGFNCSAPRNQLPDGEDQFRQFAPDTPHMIAESQGGAFTPWGASFTPEQCAKFTDAAYTRQWSVMGMANGVTAFSYYMTHGGTNWGWTGAPASGFTSYDYGAALAESRAITGKLAAQKEAGYFHRALPALAAMDPAGAPALAEHSGGAVKGYQRIAASGGTEAERFVAFRLADSNSTAETSFTTSLWLDSEDAGTKPVVVEDGDAAISYSGEWSEQADTTASGGTVRTATAKGASATLTFTGTGVKYLSASGTDFGKVRVQVDDRPAEVAHAWVSSNQNKPSQVVLADVQDLAPGEHTITVTALGEQADPSGGTKVSVDAFQIAGAPDPNAAKVHNDSSGFVTFGDGWEHASGKAWTAGDIGGDETFSARKGDEYTFKFTGVGFDLIAPFSENHGPAEVYVDGTLVGRTQEQTTTTANPQQVVFSKKDLAQGEHTVRVVVTGESFEGSSGTFVSLDAVRVHPNADSLGGGQQHEVGWARVPQTQGAKLHVHGRDAIALAVNFDLAGNRVGYSTAQLFAAPQPTAKGVVQYLMGVDGDPAEIVLRAKSEPIVEAPAGVTKTWNAEKGELLLAWTTAAQPKDIVVKGDGKPLVLRAVSREFAADVWQVFDGNRPVTVEGAHLVRGAKYDGTTLHLTGSMAKAGTLRVVADGVDQWTWNGTASTGAVPGPEQVATPTLEWRTAVGAPEADPTFDVSGWKVADSTKADNARQGPGPQQGIVLDSNHYGFFEGDVWYRASYKAAGPTISLKGNGGSGVPGHGRNPAFLQVWANGKYVGAVAADGSSKSLTLPVSAGEQVELAVLVHNLGQNLDWSDDGLSRQNRGLYDASLNSTGPVTWRIQGAQDPVGKTDPARTMYNNGGLYGERAGWHLPGYPTGDWAKATTFASDEGGLQWYATDFTLDVPQGQDQAYEVQITPRGGIRNDHSQVTIFVNGWNTGVYIGDIGPQTRFTIPAQFLNLRGTNRLTLAVAAKSAGAGPEDVKVVPVAATTGSVVGGQNDAPAYPKRVVEGSVSAEKVAAGAAVTAKASLTGAPLAGGERVRVEYLWGDSTQATAEASHSYSADGSYEVVAVARDAVSGQELARAAIGRVVAGDGPSEEPTDQPTNPAPTGPAPTGEPTDPAPTAAPTGTPTVQPTQGPTVTPTAMPSPSDPGRPGKPRPGLPQTGR